MSLCINPTCPKPDHSQNTNNRHCQSCGSDLLLQGRYRVMRLLSDNSGFGKIYTAEEPGTSKILKVLKEHHNNTAKVVELFQQEAKVLAQFQHPGIPKVDGYFQYQTRNGLILHCFVMEKIEGPNLEERLQQQGNHPISERLAIAWLKQLAEILHLVHGKQYFHRDIKPPNIMLRPNGQLVLIDFGTAREITSTYLAKMGAGYNVTGIISAGYTPPEQANGKAVPQSDFFALGRTFVYLLTGKQLHHFSEDSRTGELIWRKSTPQVSKQLGDLIDYLMAPFPGNRPQNTQVILQRLAEIEQALQSLQVQAKLPQLQTTKRTLPKPPRQLPRQFINKWLLGGASCALLALGGIQLYFYAKFRADPISALFLNNNTNSVDYPISILTSSVFLKTTLTGHSETVASIAISPNGQTLVSSSWDKSIKIWDLETGKLFRTLYGHSQVVHSVAISPNGQTLASASRDNTIKIWDIRTGKLLRTLTGHSEDFEAVAISPDGQTLASGSSTPILQKTIAGGTTYSPIKIWNLITGELLRTLPGYAVDFVAISPDGQTLISGSGDYTIEIWNLRTGDKIRTLSEAEFKGWVPNLANTLSLDGKIFASNRRDNTIKIWNLPSGEIIRTISGNPAITSIAISPDNQILVSGSGNREIKIWNLPTGELLRTLYGHKDWVSAIKISPDGQTIVTGSGDRTIKIWRVSR